MRLEIEHTQRVAHPDSCRFPDRNGVEQWVRETLMLCAISEAALGLTWVDPTEIHDLNRRFRQHDKPTTLLAFPSERDPVFSDPHTFSWFDRHYLGDLIACPQVIASHAEAQGKSLQSHWAHLIIHGLLHLLGYDHTTPDAAHAMETLEIQILTRVGFQNPYSVSTA